MTEEYIVRILENDDCITEGVLVRCRECKWYQKTYTWNGNEHMVCVELSGVGRSENDYCSRAERKVENNVQET